MQEILLQQLKARGDEALELRQRASIVKQENVGNNVYLRGLIELSNKCKKNCYYCGIRVGNKEAHRYTLNKEEVLQSAQFAYENNFGSIVLQAGECVNDDYIDFVEDLLWEIGRLSDNKLGITLSLGEQSLQTYMRWRKAGAKRYLLRIEASSEELYKKLHPNSHSYQARIDCLHLLKDADYQVGTGVMIGLPFQTYEHLVEDLLFFTKLDIDMVGMGPYLEHTQTPLYKYSEELHSKAERYEISLNMLASLRLLMPKINIASTTAMGSLHNKGREDAIRIAANVIMPNITPIKYREDYFLYENKICIDKSNEDSKQNIEKIVKAAAAVVAYGLHGDSLHFKGKA